MKVVLPSNPDISVDLKQPTFGDIRDLNDISENILIKNKLVSACVNTSIDDFTILDRDYLFFLCCSSLHKGVLRPKIKCSCNKEHSYTVSFSDFEVFDNKPNTKCQVYHFIGWRLYKFRILTVSEEEWCVNKAMSWEGYSEDLIRDIITSKTIRNRKFDYSSKESFYKSFKNLPLRAALIAQNFDKLFFHGILPIFTVKCPDCGADLEVPFSIRGEMALLSNDRVTSVFSKVAEILSFDDFLKMTVSEYECFIDSLNNGKDK